MKKNSKLNPLNTPDKKTYQDIYSIKQNNILEQHFYEDINSDDALDEETLFHNYVDNITPINHKNIVLNKNVEQKKIFHKKKKNLIIKALKQAPLNKNKIQNQEEKLFTDVNFSSMMHDVTPLTCKGRSFVPSTKKTTTLSNKEKILGHSKKYTFIINKNTEYVTGYVSGFNMETLRQLQEGHIRPQARIDLHGLNIQQAFQSVIRFFHTAYINGYQTVLVIPGRGKNSPQGISILKEKLQEWFIQEPLQRIVLAFCTAHISDGGSGALYVSLRNDKKKQNIFWNRTSIDPESL